MGPGLRALWSSALQRGRSSGEEAQMAGLSLCDYIWGSRPAGDALDEPCAHTPKFPNGQD